MKNKFGRSYILMPIGLFVLAGTMLLSQLINLADPLKGVLLGMALGLLLLPFIMLQLRKQKN